MTGTQDNNRSATRYRGARASTPATSTLAQAGDLPHLHHHPSTMSTHSTSPTAPTAPRKRLSTNWREPSDTHTSTSVSSTSWLPVRAGGRAPTVAAVGAAAGGGPPPPLAIATK